MPELGGRRLGVAAADVAARPDVVVDDTSRVIAVVGTDVPTRRPHAPARPLAAKLRRRVRVEGPDGIDGGGVGSNRIGVHRGAYRGTDPRAHHHGGRRELHRVLVPLDPAAALAPLI